MEIKNLEASQGIMYDAQGYLYYNFGYNSDEQKTDLVYELAECKVVKEIFSELLLKSGFGIMNEMEHFFSPFGWSWVVLLSESHFAIHTFPEKNYFHWQLTSCVKGYLDNFENHLAKIDFKPVSSKQLELF